MNKMEKFLVNARHSRRLAHKKRLKKAGSPAKNGTVVTYAIELNVLQSCHYTKSKIYRNLFPGVR